MSVNDDLREQVDRRLAWLETVDVYAEADYDLPPFDETFLEVFCDVRLGMHGARLQRVGFLITYGGPNVWAYVDRDMLTVEGYWGGEVYRRHGTASPSLVAWCEQFAEDIGETSNLGSL